MLDSADESWVDEEDSSPQASQLHPRDLDNFLKLCAALKHFLADRISEVQLTKADTLIREYCTELIEVRHRTMQVLHSF